MKPVLAVMVLAAAATLAGCYYDPGYSYVRSSSANGDAYYGQGSTTVYDDGYYVSPYYAPSYYYDGYYGCCYDSGMSVGIRGTWHDRPYHRRERAGDGGPGPAERHREYREPSPRERGRDREGDHREDRHRRHADSPDRR